MRFVAASALGAVLVAGSVPGAELERLQYRDPELVVDLGVGLWATPMPMDWDRDGDLDLVVVCPDKPNNGTWVFEDPRGAGLPGAASEGPANVVLLAGAALPDGRHRLISRGQLARRDLASHTTSPTVVDWNRDGRAPGRGRGRTPRLPPACAGVTALVPAGT